MKTRLIMLLVVISAALFSAGCDQSGCEADAMAFVERIEKGTSQVQRAGTQDYKALAVKDKLFRGDTIKTDDSAEVVLRFSTGAVSRVMPSTEFRIQDRKLAQTDHATVYTRLINGIAYFYIPEGNEAAKKFEVETNRAVASIKGTVFMVSATAGETIVKVAEGEVLVAATATGATASVSAFHQVSVTDQGLNGPTQVNFLSDPNLAGDKAKFFEVKGN